MSLVELCQESEITEGSARVFEVDGRSILVCRSEEVLYAIENRCSHQESPLAGGRIRRGLIACPLHGVMFELSTGEPWGHLTRVPLKTYTTSVEGGSLLVELD